MALFGEEAEKRNCYYVFLLSHGKRSAVIESIDSDAISGKQYDGNSFSKDIRILLESVNANDIEIVHNYKLNRVSFKGLFEFFIYSKTKIEYLIIYSHILSYKFRRLIYNRKRLATIHRLELLSALVDSYIEKPERGINLSDIMENIYSPMWIEHPDKDSSENKLNLYLDSFVESGEIERDKAKYFVKSKAISTLEKYEEDDRRHRRQVNLQIMMIILTVLLALIGLIQAEVIKIPTILDLTDVLRLKNK
ncbi:MAG: hypothetical protein JW914_05975 [Syntrophaceae bacterium]|nr:hypothetical protein [Syntrophaceae bacterium]